MRPTGPTGQHRSKPLDGLLARARAAQSAGNLAAAAACLRRLLKAAPGHGPACYALAGIARRQGDPAKALRWLARAARATMPGPPGANVITAYAAALGEAGRHTKALTEAERAIALDPACAAAHHTRAVALEQLGRPAADAEAAYRAALAADPAYVPALTGLAALLAPVAGAKLPRDDGPPTHTSQAEPPAPDPARAAEALRLLTDAHRLAPADPAAADALGHALRRARRFAEAVAVFRTAVEARPADVGPRVNLAVALQEAGDVDAAIAHLDHALALRPEHVDAHWNRALALLLRGHTPADADAAGAADPANGSAGASPSQTGASPSHSHARHDDLARGWLAFEWRRRLPTDKLEKRKPPHPEWDGRDLAGLRVLLRAEQGLGDTVQFVRYARALKARGAAAVVVECQPALAALLAGADAVDAAFERGRPIPLPVDVQVRLMSLPGLLGERHDPSRPLASVHATPYLRPDAARAARWAERLAALSGFKVGIAWQGNPRFPADAWRSVPLSHFAPLARVPGVRLVALQRGRGAEQLAAAKFPVHTLAPSPDDAAGGAFVDTLALCRHLDLVVTSDTALAHVAAAGARVWLVLARVPDWRWGLAGDRTPWYPSMTLYRQPIHGDWAAVFDRMAADLAPLAGAPPIVPHVSIPVAPGELADRLTILRLKVARATDPAKRAAASAELAALSAAAAKHLPPSPALDVLVADLADANDALWDVEDALRACERDRRFDAEFVALARAVYHANDRRADLKRRVNELLGAAFGDAKTHPAYPAE